MLLLAKKTEIVSEFGAWVDECWQWSVNLRRSLSNWEIFQGNEFFNLINATTLSRERQDKIIWKPDSHGVYSVKSFSGVVQNCESSSFSFLNSVWADIVPPKVELFCWQVLRERVVVNMELVKRNLLSFKRSLCTFCNTVLESVNHLFLHYQMAWKLWTACC